MQVFTNALSSEAVVVKGLFAHRAALSLLLNDFWRHKQHIPTGTFIIIPSRYGWYVAMLEE